MDESQFKHGKGTYDLVITPKDLYDLSWTTGQTAKQKQAFRNGLKRFGATFWYIIKDIENGDYIETNAFNYKYVSETESIYLGFNRDWLAALSSDNATMSYPLWKICSRFDIPRNKELDILYKYVAWTHSKRDKKNDFQDYKLKAMTQNDLLKKLFIIDKTSRPTRVLKTTLDRAVEVGFIDYEEIGPKNKREYLITYYPSFFTTAKIALKNENWNEALQYIIDEINATEAAKLLGKHRETIGKWRSGKVVPKLKDKTLILEHYKKIKAPG